MMFSVPFLPVSNKNKFKQKSLTLVARLKELKSRISQEYPYNTTHFRGTLKVD